MDFYVIIIYANKKYTIRGENLKKTVNKITLSGVFIALGILLPYMTGNIQSLGVNLLPMHIPVLLAGFIVRWKYGLLVGIITPLLRSALVGMPPLFPVAIAMAFELGIYGLVTGLLYSMLKKSKISVFISLIVAMISGRIVWGIVSYFLFFLNNTSFTINMFITGAFANSIIGIIIQLILVPIIVIRLERVGII
ncbi:ECF transporter S component [Senegalia massiliensis]|uniref:ECF transporter S component n=1 Tax=Senegalia massiliensis TaxID=1720316 RepID=A0A845QWH2_9CLOT|nr:ECF transporter S component [Senegalia massiliensis]